MTVTKTNFKLLHELKETLHFSLTTDFAGIFLNPSANELN